MIKLGKLTDYAVAVMVQLSKGGGQDSAQALAGKTGLPEPTVAKVLKQLAREKLVDSVRGAGGGYRLAKPAGQTTIASVITAMDGPIAIVSCVEDSGETCASAANCPARGNWDAVNRAIRSALESVSIADLGKSSGGRERHPVILKMKENVSHA